MRFLRLLLLLIVAITMVYPAIVNTNIYAWWNASWTERKVISFNASTIGTNQTNFPVHVALTPSNVDFSKIKSGGADIRFVDSDDATALSYEIERWDDTPGSERGVVWVKVPQINANSNYSDFIYMYYGNAAAVDAQNAADVWSNGYISVYHMGDGVDLSGTTLAIDLNAVQYNLGITNGASPRAQTFTSPAFDTQITGVRLNLTAVGGDSGTFTYLLQGVVGGLPDGVTLATGSIASTAIVAGWGDYMFVAPASVTNDTVYSIVCYTDAGGPGVYVDWPYDSLNPYAGGNRITFGGGIWIPQAGNDAWLEVYYLDMASNVYVGDSVGGNNGVKADTANPAQNTTGVVGYAQTFNSAMWSTIDCGNDASLTPVDVTVEAWWNWTGAFDAIPSSPNVVSKKWDNTHNEYGFYFPSNYVDNMNLTWVVGDGLGGVDHVDVVDTDDITNYFTSTNTWMHSVGTFSDAANTTQIYTNGVAIPTDPLHHNVGRHTDVTLHLGDDGHSLYIGGRQPAYGLFNGQIDEIRISDVARSDDWVEATYMDGAGTLLYYGGATPEPTVTSQAATGITMDKDGVTGGTFNGTLVSLGGAPTCDTWFDYGLTNAYGSNTAHVAKIATGAFTASVPINLIPNTTYHYRAHSSNVIGEGVGADQSFTFIMPQITTLAATQNRYIRGQMFNMGVATSAYYRFEWGYDATYGNNTAWTTTNIAGTFQQDGLALPGINPLRTIYYRFAVRCGTVTIYGANQTIPVLPRQVDSYPGLDLFLIIIPTLICISFVASGTFVIIKSVSGTTQILIVSLGIVMITIGLFAFGITIDQITEIRKALPA